MTEIDMMVKRNTGRQFELDLVRSLAVLFMVMIHVQTVFAASDIYSGEEGALTMYTFVNELLGGVPAAPVFMFLLGVGIIYMKEKDADTLLKRGIFVFFSGYILNFVRSVLPILISAFTNNYDVSLLKAELYFGFWTVDILQFAGLSLIFFGIMKRINAQFLTYAVTGVLFALINMFLIPIMPKSINPIIDPVLSLFVGGVENLSYFPFLTWIAYPIAGFIFGYFLYQTHDKEWHYKYLLLSSTIAVTIYVLGILFLGFPTGYETDAGYYFHTALVNVFYISFVLMWISVFYYVSKLIKGKFRTYIIEISKLTNQIYNIHWVIIGFVGILIPAATLLQTPMILLTILILFTSIILAKIYVEIMRHKRK